MTQRRDVVHGDPEILGGTPVFVGTRVPVKSLLDYLEGGHRLDDFLDDFPTVTREQAVAALEEGLQMTHYPSTGSEVEEMGCNRSQRSGY